MAKTKPQEWDTTAGNNTDIGGINIAENCPAANLNNAQRETMAQIAAALSGSDDSIITGTAGTSGNLGQWNADGDLVDATSVTITSDWTIGDNVSFLFGNSNQMDIYHNGTSTGNIVAENLLVRATGAGAGPLSIAGKTVNIKDEANSETMASFASDGAVSLYYDNSVVLATTAAGVTVTGVLTHDGHGSDEDNALSSTSTDITGIPAGVTEVDVIIDSATFGSAAVLLIQLGDSGGIETTGYEASVGIISPSGGGTASVSSSTAGFLWNNATDHNGIITLKLHSASNNTWVATGTSKLDSGGALTKYHSGVKSLSAAIDRIRVTTTGGTETFTGGTVTVRWRT